MRWLLLGILLLLMPVQAQAQTWTFHKSEDPMGGAMTAVVSPPLNLLVGNVPNSARLFLSVVCQNSSTPKQMLVYWGKYFAGNLRNEVSVRFRFEDHEALNAKPWKLDSGQAAKTFVSSVPIEYSGLRRYNFVTVEVIDPLDGERIVMSGTLAGFSAAADQLAC